MTAKEVLEIMRQSRITGGRSKMRNKECADVIIEALEKQLPKKPLNISNPDENDNSDVECICHANNQTAVKRIKSIYCWRCGQYLSWAEVE